jgi:hypothetical protein
MATYTIYAKDGLEVLTLVLNGEVYQAANDHPMFEEIKDCLLVGAFDEAVPLFDLAGVAADRFSVSERVAVENGTVFFDGDPIDNSLTKQIVRFLRDGHPVEPLVRFWENLAANPSQHSREQLYDWLAPRDFTITEDGCFIAYKGVNTNLTSISRGPAYVDDQPVNGNVPNPVGAVVTIQRSYVDADSFVGCSTGLHAGTWEYASSFGPTTVKVKINPRDVVSVPTDCEAQKLRVCRYEVLEVIDAPDDAALVSSDGTEYDSLGRPLPKRDRAGRFVKAFV